jgi:hypothetical protein
MDAIKLLRTKLEKMDIDDVRDIVGDNSYTEATQRLAREIVDRYDYRQGAE